MSPSPFVVGQWVRGERFFGRARLIDEILHGHRNWIWVLGTRRVGKTSLLKQLEWLAGEGAGEGVPAYLPLFWDFQGADEPRDLHRGFREALLDAEERLEPLGIDAEALDCADLFDALGTLRRRLRPRGVKLLLLCDEVEELIQLDKKDPALLRRLRRSMQSHEDVRSVLVSTIRLWALSDQRSDTSPFLHGFAPPLYIGGLAAEASRALIGQGRPGEAGGNGGARFDEATVEKIRTRCDDHPYLMQLVCKRFSDLGDLDDAFEQVAGDPMVSHFFAVDFEMLSPAEQRALCVIGQSSPASSNSVQEHLGLDADSLSGVLHRLERLGYLRRNAERRFELVNHFFRRWLRERAPGEPLGAAPSAQKAGPATPGGGEATPWPGPGTPVPPAAGAERLLDGRYELGDEIGRGATGTVYRARDTLLGETLAVKVLKPECSSDEESLERLRREILLARDLDHPNILKVYHFGDHEGRKYFTMRLVPGTTLAKRIRDGGALPLAQTVAIGARLASALEAAHGKGVIHRDVKPQNVLLDERDTPYLTDFGLARLLGDPGMTRTGVFLGTPYYAAPEQAKLLPVDERTDLYALGVVLFEMATGKRPFVADSAREVLDMHASVPPPDPRGHRPEIPAVLVEVIARCLQKNPSHRYPSARRLRQALEH